jgi:hypothetical protein
MASQDSDYQNYGRDSEKNGRPSRELEALASHDAEANQG